MSHWILIGVGLFEDFFPEFAHAFLIFERNENLMGNFALNQSGGNTGQTMGLAKGLFTPVVTREISGQIMPGFQGGQSFLHMLKNARQADDSGRIMHESRAYERTRQERSRLLENREREKQLEHRTDSKTPDAQRVAPEKKSEEIQAKKEKPAPEEKPQAVDENHKAESARKKAGPQDDNHETQKATTNEDPGETRGKQKPSGNRDKKKSGQKSDNAEGAGESELNRGIEELISRAVDGFHEKPATKQAIADDKVNENKSRGKKNSNKAGALPADTDLNNAEISGKKSELSATETNVLLNAKDLKDAASKLTDKEKADSKKMGKNSTSKTTKDFLSEELSSDKTGVKKNEPLLDPRKWNINGKVTPDSKNKYDRNTKSNLSRMGENGDKTSSARVSVSEIFKDEGLKSVMEPNRPGMESTFLRRTGVVDTRTSLTEGARGEKSENAAANRDLFNKLVEKARVNLGPRGVSTASIRMNPPELGRMTLNLKLNNSRLEAKLLVDSVAAKNLLSEDLEGLRQDLRLQGIQVDSFSIKVREPEESRDSSAFGEQNLNNDNLDNNQGRESGERDEQNGSEKERVHRELSGPGEDEYGVNLAGKKSVSTVNVSV